VIAAGNNGATNGISAPGCISSAISVGSTTKSDTISSFSNSASFLSVLAPGSSILSSVPGGGFAVFSGTSMATPHVAGAWAIVKQKSPQASVATVLDALVTTGALLTDPRNGITKPRIDVAGAVALITGQSATSLTVNGSSAPITVAAGSTVTLGVQNGPGTPSDCVSIFKAGSGDWWGYAFVNGSTATMPFFFGTAGTYEFHFWQRCTTLLTTSPTVTVQGSLIPRLTVNGSSAPITVTGGTTISVGVQNGPGNQWDCVSLNPAGNLASAWLNFTFVSGSTPTLSFVMPSTPGTYEFRFWQQCNTLLTTSPPVTAQ
jgi:hypothetical protein